VTAGLALIMTLGLFVGPVATARAESGTVGVEATSNAKITITINDATGNFGTTLEPEGETSNSTEVVGIAGTSGNQGSYYVWKSSTGTGLKVTVKSNKAWNGTIAASVNTGGASSMTIASGVLRYRYYESPATPAAPTSYADAADDTAFTTVAATWQSNHAKGATEFIFYYSLRLD